MTPKPKFMTTVRKDRTSQFFWLKLLHVPQIQSLDWWFLTLRRYHSYPEDFLKYRVRGLWWADAEVVTHSFCLLVFMPWWDTFSVPGTCDLLLTNSIWQRRWASLPWVGYISKDYRPDRFSPETLLVWMTYLNTLNKLIWQETVGSPAAEISLCRWQPAGSQGP